MSSPGTPKIPRGAKITWHYMPKDSLLAKLWERASKARLELRFTPEETTNLIDEFNDEFPSAKFGAAHNVLSDFNLSACRIGESIRACLEEIGTPEDRSGLEAAHFMACLLMLDEDEMMFPKDEDDSAAE